MKVSSFTAEKYSGMKVFKPVQYLHITGQSKTQELSSVKLRARLVNSENGRVDEIIPLLSIDVLGEICSMNEGFFTSQRFDGFTRFSVSVMLHPTSAVYLSNDKFLEVDIEGLSAEYETAVYGIEKPVVDKEFICRYNKFYMTAGELQKTFSVGDNENLILPGLSFEEVTMHYNNGSSCVYTQAELSALMKLQNDIVSVPSNNVQYALTESDDPMKYFTLVFGYDKMFGLDVSDVETFTIRRSQANTAFEFVLIDTIKD